MPTIKKRKKRLESSSISPHNKPKQPLFPKDLLKRNIHFTLHPSEKQTPQHIQPSHRPVDLHWEMIQKIDKVLQEHEKERSVEELSSEKLTEKQPTVPTVQEIEPRESLTKKMEPSDFAPVLHPETTIPNQRSPEFAVPLSPPAQPDFRFITSFEPAESVPRSDDIVILPATNTDLLKRILGNVDVSVQKNAMGFLGVKRRTNDDRQTVQQKQDNTPQQQSTTTDSNEETANENQELSELETAKQNVVDAEKIMEKKKKELESLEKKANNVKKGSRKKNGLETLRREVEQARNEVEKRKSELAEIEQQLKTNEQETKEKERDLKRRELERRKKEKEEKQLKQLEKEESYIPLDLNHRVQELKQREQDELERKELARQRLEQEAGEHKIVELKQIERLAREKEKQLRREEKRKQKELQHKQKLEEKQRCLEERQQLLAEKKQQREVEKEQKQLLKKDKEQKQAMKKKYEPPKGKGWKKKTLAEKPQESVAESTPVPSPELETPVVTEIPQKQDDVMLDEELRQVLKMTDELLAKLPDEVIEKFAQSEDFRLYEKVLQKYKIK